MKITKPIHPKQIGEVTEAVIVAILLSKGFGISKPYGDNCSYDLLVDFGDKISKVQIKTGKLKGNKIIFNTARNRINTQKSYRKSYTEEEVDIFLVYCYETEKVYKIPNIKLPKSSMVLRVENSTNSSSHPADNYIL